MRSFHFWNVVTFSTLFCLTVFSQQILLSFNPDRSNASPLQGSLVASNTNIFIFYLPADGTQTSQVKFYIDQLEDPPMQVENLAPWDFAGSGQNIALPYVFNYTSVAEHIVFAHITNIVQGRQVINTLSATFTLLIPEVVPIIKATSLILSFVGVTSSLSTRNESVTLSVSTGHQVDIIIQKDASWFDVNSPSLIIPENGTLVVDVTINTNNIQPSVFSYAGSFSIISATNNQIPPGVIGVRLVIGDAELRVSTSPNRTPSSLLEGAPVVGSVAIFLDTFFPQSPSNVKFYLDTDVPNPNSFVRQENLLPWDFAGSAPDVAVLYDTTQLIDGTHTILAEVQLSTAQIELYRASFNVLNNIPAVNVTPSSISIIKSSFDSMIIPLVVSFQDQISIVVNIDDSACPSSISVNQPSVSLGLGQVTAVHILISQGLITGSCDIEFRPNSGNASPFMLPVQVKGAVELSVSYSSSRVPAFSLAESVVSGIIYVFTSSTDSLADSITSVSFFLDNGTAPVKTEGVAPFDFAGTANSGLGNGFDTSTLHFGPHEISATVSFTDGTSIKLSSSFQVLDSTKFLIASQISIEINVDDLITSTRVFISTSDGAQLQGIVAFPSPTFLVVSVDDASREILIDIDATFLPTGLSIIRGAVRIEALNALYVPVFIDVTVVRPSFFQFPLRFNFGPAGADVPSYTLDFGQPFSSQAGMNFGWKSFSNGNPVDFASNTRNRGSLSSVEDTLTMMQPSTSLAQHGVWEILLPNGEYVVSATVGDIAFVDSTYSLKGNAKPIIPPTIPTLSNPIIRGSAVISVTNNILRIDASGGQNTKIIALSIQDETGCIPFPSQFNGRQISTLSCPLVRVSPPFSIRSNSNGIKDLNGNSIGFTAVIPNNGITFDAYYDPSLLEATAQGLLMKGTSGTWSGPTETHKNSLAVGLPLPSFALNVTASLQLSSSGFQTGERICMFFGISDANYASVCCERLVTSTVLKIIQEVNNVAVVTEMFNPPLGFDGSLINFKFVLIPATNELQIYVSILESVSDFFLLRTFLEMDPAWFSKDAAGIDIFLKTRSFVGINIENSASTSVYVVREFVVETQKVQPLPPVPPSGLIDFNLDSISNIMFPTAMQFGPNQLLYVANALGNIFVIDVDKKAILKTYGPSDYTTRSDQTRLLLGIAIDPDSTLENLSLYLCHSDGSFNNGAANSGTVSKLVLDKNNNRVSGQDIFIGLPRAIANHAPNGIHFGPDKKLYMGIGGNTGAGASNDGTSEFGSRPEQSLTNAILVFDVKSTQALDRDCTPNADPNGSIMDATGIAPRTIDCDVSIYATGFRNPYDFTFVKENDGSYSLYATDNGLGVEGTVPKIKPDGTCEGPISGNLNPFNPGPRHDLLIKVEQGQFYGFPNPTRNQCVFYAGNPSNPSAYTIPATGGGTYSMTATKVYPDGQNPPTNLKLPVYSLGLSHSADGIVAYTSQAFCGELYNDLLINYYSQEDQVRRIIRKNGVVVGDETLRKSTSGTGGSTLSDPLPITTDVLGRIVVGEFGSNKLRIFRPTTQACWQQVSIAVAPRPLVDSGSDAIGTVAYLFGGKNNADGHLATVYAYDAWTNMWSSKPPIPYGGVENPTVSRKPGTSQIYVVSGSTAPFSGEVGGAAIFDASTSTWTNLPDIPTPRGGAASAFLGNNLYIIGGLVQGASVNSVAVFNTVTKTWTSGPVLPFPIDNGKAVAIGGKIYLFGGRHRQAGINELATTFVLESGIWTALNSMPSARRSSCVVAINGKAIVFGGEFGTNGDTSSAAEEYDPVEGQWTILPGVPDGRHGTGCAYIGNGAYIFQGESNRITRDDSYVLRYEYLE